jgi:enterochelin esterase-like enzyme
MKKSAFFKTELGEYGDLEFITIKSPALKRRGDICVYRPEASKGKKAVKMVVLLHGVYGSHWVWSMKGSVHETLERLIHQGKVEPMILVMPSDGLYADGSAYVEHQDADYEKWIVEDVITACKENIEEVSEQSEMYIAGLSMGGYGALRLGAKYPSIFKGFSGHSSITDFFQMGEFVEDFSVLKENARVQESVLEVILTNQDLGLNFRFDCGKNDLLIEHNRRLHEELKKFGIEHVYEEFSGGHEWPYWRKHIVSSLLYFDQL